MRVSTNMIYQQGVGSLQQQTSSLLKIQQQLATGRRVLTPSDDPIASARTLELRQSQAVNQQFAQNMGYANDNLGLLENGLTGIGDILQYTREKAVQAGNGSMNAEDLRLMATDLRAQFDALIAIGNSQDGQGNFIFSGYKANTQPFSGTLAGVTYAGDQGDRTIQISASRYLPVSLPGVDVFDRTRRIDGNQVTDNDALYSTAGRNNKGTAGALTVSLDAASLPLDKANQGRRYIATYEQPDPAVAGTWRIQEVVPGVGRRDVNAAEDGLAFDAGPPQTATFNGISIELPDDPPPTDASDPTSLVDGDAFEVIVASTNTFDNYALFVSALEDSTDVGVAGGVAFALENLDFALDTVLKARTQVGSHMTEVEQLQSLGSDLDLQYATAISRLEDVDWTKAISDLMQQQTYLQAAQQSFLRVSGLSLFNFLS